MDNIGEQIHPNWMTLATVNISLKRFIKEGTTGAHIESRFPITKYKVPEVNGGEIREFYEALVNKEDKEHTETFIKIKHKFSDQNKSFKQKPKESFDLRNFFRFSLENKVEELKKMNFENANFNVCDSYGWSALMIASCEGACEAVKFLIGLGVDKHIKDKSGRTALDLAQKKGFIDIVNILERADSDLEEKVQPEEQILSNEPFSCEICNQSFTETSRSQHFTSTIHQFNIQTNLPPNKLQKFNIPSLNKGLQLMVKQGWDKESGLGPSQSGRLYPIKTVIRKQRSGLGIKQKTACITHFKAYDRNAVQRNNMNNYKKKPRNRNDIKREKIREWKQDRRLRNELN